MTASGLCITAVDTLCQILVFFTGPLVYDDFLGAQAQHTLDLSLRLRKMHSAAIGKRFTAGVILDDLQLRFYAFYASNPNLNVRPDAQCVITSPPVLISFLEDMRRYNSRH